MDKKKIFRVEKNKNYSVISNKIFMDTRISWGAKGVLGYALTRPDNWELHMNEVVSHSPDGITKVSGYFKELRKYGYLKFIRYYNDKGKIYLTEYLIYENPIQENNSQIKDLPIKKNNKSLKKSKDKENLETEKLKSDLLESENLVLEKLKLENLTLLSTDKIINTNNILSTNGNPENQKKSKNYIDDLLENKRLNKKRN